MSYKEGDYIDVISGELAGKTLEVKRVHPGGVVATFIGHPKTYIFSKSEIKPSDVTFPDEEVLSPDGTRL